MKLEHIAFNVQDPARAAAWYVEHLGLRLVRSGEGAPFAHFLADDGDCVVEFYRNDGAAVPDYGALSPWTLHVAVQVDDIAAEHHRLLEAGATAVGAINTTPDGDLLGFVRDPWGLTLQLVQRADPLL